MFNIPEARFACPPFGLAKPPWGFDFSTILAKKLVKRIDYADIYFFKNKYISFSRVLRQKESINLSKTEY